MLQRRLMQGIFDRSTTRLSRFAACGLIGAIVVFSAGARSKLPLAWWQMSAGGALLGFAAAVVAWCYDVARDGNRTSGIRLFAAASVCFGAFFLSICIVVLINVVIGKERP